MTNLIINRVNYFLSRDCPDLYLSKSDNLLFRMKFKDFSERILNPIKDDLFTEWSNDLNLDDYLYYSFTKPNSDDFFTLKSSFYSFNNCIAKFVREQLICYFSEKKYIIEPFPKGSDLSVYEKVSDFNSNWSVYRRYDLLVRPHRKEIVFNIGSENTLISNQPQQFQVYDKIRIIDNKSNFIRPLGGEPGKNNCRIIANREKRAELGISNEPRKLNYNKLYQQLASFYNSQLLGLETDNFKIEAGGLKNVDVVDLNKVNINENQMLFGKDKTDINAVTGMRDYGIYKPSPIAMEVKFIFIYQNRDDANKLYLYFKNGLKHYPGLWSYISVPITLDPDIKLQYNPDTFRQDFDNFYNNTLSNDTYINYFAIVIEPFSSVEKQELEDEKEEELYFYIKGKLLEKNIPSQFIHYKSIRSGSFHYFLPNISIGILAKLGGIPWRLKTKKMDELVVGFNQKAIGENRFIGSAVFFSNDGELGKTFGFPETNSETALISNLKSAIQQYILQKESPPDRLVIHYYKPQSRKEKESIEYLIQKELRLNIPFAIVEINDSKSQLDICFDQDFSMGMPESGTYVRVSKREYLLFNNTRYQKNPLRSVVEELPVKIAIHFADTGGFSHKDLISQVYEFSRLYWKGLKQRSQPATTIYAKLIAEFAANYKGDLPNNDTINNTPWFL